MKNDPHIPQDLDTVFEALANKHGRDIHNALGVKIGSFTCRTYRGSDQATRENSAQALGRS